MGAFSPRRMNENDVNLLRVVRGQCGIRQNVCLIQDQLLKLFSNESNHDFTLMRKEKPFEKRETFHRCKQQKFTSLQTRPSWKHPSDL